MESHGDASGNVTSGVEAEAITAEKSATQDGEVDEDVREITRDNRFRFLAQDFADAIEAFRETHDELSPAASELDSITHTFGGTFEGSKRLTEEDRELLASVFRDVPESGLPASQFVDRLWLAVKDTEWGSALPT